MLRMMMMMMMMMMMSLAKHDPISSDFTRVIETTLSFLSLYFLGQRKN